MLLSIVIASCVSSISFCDTLEEIKGKLDKSSGLKTSSILIFDIQKIHKDRVVGWGWSGDEGTRSLLAITVKFKIREKGDCIKIPHLCVYLFDREKNQIRKIKRFFYKTSTGSEIGSEMDYFKRNKTYQLQFPYSVSDKFRYVIAVVGNDNDCAFAILPRSASVDDFEFVEKYLVK